MHAWLLLGSAWSAELIVYWLLALIAYRRLHGRDKELNHLVVIVMVVLVAVRFWIHYRFGGQAYRLAVLIVGVAAGVATLVVVKMLISQSPDDKDGAIGNKDRIESLES